MLPGPGGYAAATIIANNVGKTGFLILWTFVCFTAFAVVATARKLFSFSLLDYSQLTWTCFNS